MSQDNVIELKKPETFVDDPISDILRQGARKLLAEALEAEIESFLALYADLKDPQGHQRVTDKYLAGRHRITKGFFNYSVAPPVPSNNSLSVQSAMAGSASNCLEYSSRSISLPYTIPAS